MAVDNSLIVVDGVAMPQPYQYSWNLQDVSAPGAGRTEDALMHKDRVGQKRKLALSWRMKDPSIAATILQAFDPEYFQVRYWDVKDNCYETRTFYAGDREAPVKLWWVGRHLIETISFDVIER